MKTERTIIAILILSSEVDSILQQHRADGGQVLLGGQVQRSLPVFGQLVHFGSGKQLEDKNSISCTALTRTLEQ